MAPAWCPTRACAPSTSPSSSGPTTRACATSPTPWPPPLPRRRRPAGDRRPRSPGADPRTLRGVKVLITGAGGALGRELVSVFAGHDVAAASHDVLDVADRDVVGLRRLRAQLREDDPRAGEDGSGADGRRRPARLSHLHRGPGGDDPATRRRAATRCLSRHQPGGYDMVRPGA